MKITFKPDSILVLSYSRQILEGKKDFNKIRAPKNSNLKEMIAYNLGIVYPEPIEEPIEEPVEEITEETAEVVAPTEEKEDADQTEETAETEKEIEEVVEVIEPAETEKEIEEVVETPIKQTKPMPKPKHVG